MRWGPTDNADAAEGDGANARRAAQAIEELKDQPFFMAVGFYKPHVPLIAPQKYFDMYSPSDIEVRTGPKVKGNFHRYLRGYAKRDLTDQDAREIVAAYYACTTFMDAQFGLLLDALDRSEQADNTVIVLWGDHGWLLGEHWRWAKHNLYEETCRVPLIVAGPGVDPSGRRSSALVESVDIYPTLAELCGLTPPSGLEGLTMVPLARDPVRAWKKGAFTQHKQKDVLGASVRTGRYRYTEWGGPDRAELYDHERDPHEYRNVATDPSYAAAVGDLRQLLRGGWQAALP